jgi:hypothetical protein
MTRKQFNAGLIQELNFRKDHAEARITRLDSEIRAQLDRLPVDIPANRIVIMRQLHAVQGFLIEAQAERELISTIEQQLTSVPMLKVDVPIVR